ncbi:hypothetical protein E2C01_004975 [Portunus trituberculatus]|uniref:Uncharacterized protein n=1 Tax=Portunus trituberculatus TaxID=210409 RepID=A0A5B7CTS8_PORTR|nr:hypothetical protein [Portunus trituberculatus]
MFARPISTCVGGCLGGRQVAPSYSWSPVPLFPALQSYRSALRHVNKHYRYTQVVVLTAYPAEYGGNMMVASERAQSQDSLRHVHL